MTSDIVTDKTIGSIIQAAKNLTAEQVERVLEYQRANDVKFGEAAVALGYAEAHDVLWALSKQFKYDYSPVGSQNISAELVVAKSPFGEDSELFRDLRSQLLSTFEGTGKRRALAIISANTGDGKTFFASNLATAFCQLGGRTLLVDADLRTPRLHEVFGIDARDGLSGILAGRAEPNVIKPIEQLPNLYVLPVGIIPPNPLELLQSPAFSLLMDELILKFDYVIVDTPAAVHGADSRVVASVCGCSLAIAREGKSSLQPVKELVKKVDRKNANFLGVVMNKH